MKSIRTIIPVLLGLSIAHAAESGKSDHNPMAYVKPTTSAPPVSSEYELRGFFGTGNDLEISLAKKDEKTSRWMKIGRKVGDLFIETADAKAGTAILVNGGSRSTLRLAKETGDTSEPQSPSPSESGDFTAGEAFKSGTGKPALNSKNVRMLTQEETKRVKPLLDSMMQSPLTPEQMQEKMQAIRNVLGTDINNVSTFAFSTADTGKRESTDGDMDTKNSESERPVSTGSSK